MRALVLAVLLGVAQYGLRPSAPTTSARPVAERFSGAVHSAFLGGFRPILVQYLWWDVEAAWDEGRHHDVLENLALLERIDATNAKAILYMARFRAYTLAQAESMPSRKLGQIQTAVRLLEDAQVRLKDEVTLPLLRAMILTARWDTSDDSGEQDDLRYRRLYENWTKRRGRTPYAEALDAMEDAAVIAPNARVVRRLLSEALRYRAMELALVGSKHDEAHRFLRRAVAIDAETPGAGATLGARLIVAWEAVLDGLARSEAGSCGRGLDRLRLTLASLDRPGTDGDVREEMLTIAILHPCINLGRAALTRGQPGDALSLIVAIHKIQTAIEERLAARGGSGNRQKIHEDLRGLAAGLLERAPQFSDRIPPSLR